jgi:hypothetical protein
VESVEALVVNDESGAAETAPVPVADARPTVDTQTELLRLFEVVTTMCDHVIGYIEADRAERQLMMETLAQLGRIITDGAAAAVAANAAQPVTSSASPLEIPADPGTPRIAAKPEPFAFAKRERVIGGSMPAGPEPIIDLAQAEAEPDDDVRAPAFPDQTSARAAHPAGSGLETAPPATSMEIAVQVRGRFGDRWVDGFEICEVMTTPSGPRYRLRRQRDGVVLPELFDATNIRHVETFDQLDGAGHNRSAKNGAGKNGVTVNGSGTNGTTNNGATGYWSRS